MKVLRQMAIVFTLLMLLILVVFLYLNKQFAFEQRDLIYYNDQLHKVEKEYASGAKVAEIEKRYNCRIVKSTEISNQELAELYRNSAFILDFAPNGEYIGKVAWLDELNRYNTTRNGFFGIAIAAWAAILIAGFIMIGYFYRYLIKPIKELSGFSAEIAKGNLDVALPIHRHNLFGEFVEAFDLMREQLIIARNREIEAEKARKELVTELSHDIKTPVAVIKATCEVLEVKACQGNASVDTFGSNKTNGEDENVKKTVPLTQKEILEKTAVISQKADTISQLVSNMMHANLEDLEQLDIHVTEENSLIIREYFTNLKQYGNVIMDNEIPGCLVYMDRLRMEQAIDNVVGNSYKYAGTDVHVSFDTFAVETEIVEEGQDNGAGAGNGAGNTGVAASEVKLKKVEFLRIRIKDSGPGVSEEDLPLISEKYYRGSNAEKVPGSGLGFYLVKYYMQKQGGGMEYYNDDGFVVELLLKKV